MSLLTNDELKVKLDLELKESRGKQDEFCLEEGCDRLAGYNYANNSHKYYCTNHKLDNMINLWECHNCSHKVKFKNNFLKKK
jgi:hypothetical protein